MLLFRLYEKVTQKYTRGLRPSGLRGAVQNPCGEILGKFETLSALSFFAKFISAAKRTAMF